MHGAALAFLLRRRCVLLAQKREGATGIDLWTGYGGKVDGIETIKAALVRELVEESTLVVKESDLFLSAVVTTYQKKIPQFELNIFTGRKWLGDPQDTAEMHNHRWWPFNRLPLAQMRRGDQQWLPRVLRGEKFEADVHLNQRGELRQDVLYRPGEFLSGLT